MPTRLIAYTDGGGDSRPETEAYIGLIITDRDTGEVVCEHSEAIGQVTHNEAEYSAVLFAMYWAVEHGATDLLVKSDSQLIVKQINGQYRVTRQHLADYLHEVRQTAEDLLHFKIEWIPREENKVADRLTWEARV